MGSSLGFVGRIVSTRGREGEATAGFRAYPKTGDAALTLALSRGERGLFG